MIVRYTIATLTITDVVPGSDPVVFNNYDVNKDVGQVVFITADDPAVNEFNYYVLESSPGVPVSVLPKNGFLLTATSPIDLSDTPVMTVQIINQSGVPQAISGVVVAFTVKGGRVSAPTATTDIAGAATVTIHPAKGFKLVQITANSALHTEGRLEVQVNLPSTTAKQNWLEAADIKDNAVAANKLDGSVSLKFDQQGERSYITTSYLADQFSVGFSLGNISAMVTDDADFLYTLGQLPSTDYAIVKSNRSSGVVVGTWTFPTGWSYSGNGEQLCYDGKHIVISVTDASGNKGLARIKTGNMQLSDVLYQPAGPQKGIYGVVFDGILYYVLCRIAVGIGNWGFATVSPETGNWGFSNEGPGNDVNGGRVTMNKDWAMALLDPLTVGTGLGGVYLYKSGSLPRRIEFTNLASSGLNDITTDGTSVYTSMWYGGGPDLNLMIQKWNIETGTFEASAPYSLIGKVWQLCFDGTYLWALCFNGPVAGNYLRKFDTDLNLLQSINLAPASPNAMASDGRNIYVGNSNLVEY